MSPSSHGQELSLPTTIPTPQSPPPPSNLFDHETVNDHITQDPRLPPFELANLLSDNPTLPLSSTTVNLCFAPPEPIATPEQMAVHPPELPRTYDHYGIPRDDISYYRDMTLELYFSLLGATNVYLQNPYPRIMLIVTLVSAQPGKPN